MPDYVVQQNKLEPVFVKHYALSLNMAKFAVS